MHLTSAEFLNDPWMLIATHESATDWSLVVGDRDIVDSLPKKTMF
jgi:hypothetical protein